jgi:hypothetical protein
MLPSSGSVLDPAPTNLYLNLKLMMKPVKPTAAATFLGFSMWANLTKYLQDRKTLFLFVWTMMLQMFENRVLRRIFGPKRDEVTEEWRKVHNEELHILYSSPNIIRQIKSRRMRWAGHVARMGKDRNVYKVFMGKPKGKRPLGRPRRRLEDGI